ncbi:hypothetical protein DRN69_03810 [Candidatus Pacearchaeota archaeon]|nr:MAG: hypothetical protein DRN69_03810 [Candidatus Pacearchaeota archaeon]
MESSKEIAARYKLLFRLPSYRDILIRTTLSSIIFGIIHGMGKQYFTGDDVLKNIILFIIMYYILPAVLSTYITVKMMKREILTERRLAGLSLFTVLFMGISNITGVTISIIMNSILAQEIVTIVSCGIIMSLKYLVICTLERKKVEAFLSSILHYAMCVISGVWIYQLIGKYGILNVILRSFYVAGSFTITSWFLMDAVDKVGLKVIQIEGIKLFNAFTKYWLANRKDKIEEILEKYSHEEDVKIKNIIFFDEENKPKYTIIIPEFHFGPFRDLGSSQFPHIIIDQLERDNIKAVVLHGISEHGQDIANTSDCKKIIRRIIEENFKAKPDRTKATNIIKIKKGKCTIYCQLFEDTALLIVTRAPNLTEDLPMWIKREIKDKAKKLGIKDVMIIDAHNSIRENEQLSDKDYKEIIEAAEKALTKVKNLNQNKLKIGISRKIIKEYTEEQGIGKGGVIGLTIGTEKQMFTFIVYDGNNMIPEFREKVIKRLMQEKISNVEVLTTDTHSVNGLTPEERGYHPVGEIDHKEVLVKYAIEVAEESNKKVTYMNYTIREITVESIKVLGEDLLAKFSKAISEALRIAKKVSIAAFTLSTVTSIILFLI